MPKTKDTKIKKTASKKVEKKPSKKVSDTKKKTTAKKVDSKAKKTSKTVAKKVSKTTAKKEVKTTKKKVNKPVNKKTSSGKKVVKKNSKVLVDNNLNEYDSVLDSNNTYPTDAIYETLLKENYEPEVRVSDVVDNSINQAAKKGIIFRVISILIILAILYFIVANFYTALKNSGTIYYQLSDISSMNIDYDGSIRLPSSWTLTTDGKAFETDRDNVKMVIYSDKINASQFEKKVSSLNATFVSKGKSNNQALLYYVNNIYDAGDSELIVDYFLHYDKGILTEFIFSGCDYKTEIKIVESLNY